MDGIMRSMGRHGLFLAIAALHLLLSVATTVGALVLFGIGLENHFAVGIVEGLLVVYEVFRFPLLTLVDIGVLSSFHTSSVPLEFILVPMNSVIAGYVLTLVVQCLRRRMRSPER